MFSGHSPAKTSIEQANKHIQMLCDRIDKLESDNKALADELVKKQDELQKRDKEFQVLFSNSSVQKDSELSKLREQVISLSENSAAVQANLDKKDALIQRLTLENSTLRRIHHHKNAFLDILNVIESTQSGDVLKLHESSSLLEKTHPSKSYFGNHTRQRRASNSFRVWIIQGESL